MTQPIYKSFTLQTCDTQISIGGTNRETDPDFFASNVTGATWALTATETTDGMAHQVTIRNDAATDHSGKTATVTGFYGIYPISEVVTLGAGNTTVKSTKFFTKLTSVVPSATIGADTMDIGICEICRSPIIKSCHKGNNEGINITIVSGTAVNYTWKFTRSKIEPNNYTHYTNCYTDLYDSWNWFDHDDADAIDTSSKISTNTQEPPTAYALQINSYTQSTNPVIDIDITQSDIG